MTKKQFTMKLTDTLATFFRGKTDTTGMGKIANQVKDLLNEVNDVDFALTNEEVGDAVWAAKLQVRVMMD